MTHIIITIAIRAIMTGAIVYGTLVIVDSVIGAVRWWRAQDWD